MSKFIDSSIDLVYHAISNVTKKLRNFSLLKVKMDFKTVICHTEKNAEAGRRRDAGFIDESLVENRISSSIIDAVIEVHKILGGPGLLENIYEEALAYELEQRNISFKRQLVPVLYPFSNS